MDAASFWTSGPADRKPGSGPGAPHPEHRDADSLPFRRSSEPRNRTPCPHDNRPCWVTGAEHRTHPVDVIAGVLPALRQEGAVRKPHGEASGTEPGWLGTCHRGRLRLRGMTGKPGRSLTASGRPGFSTESPEKSIESTDRRLISSPGSGSAAGRGLILIHVISNL